MLALCRPINPAIANPDCLQDNRRCLLQLSSDDDDKKTLKFERYYFNYYNIKITGLLHVRCSKVRLEII